MSRLGLLSIALLVVITTMVSIADAANDVWDGNGASPPNNNWNFAPSWADNTTPGNSDTATFNIANTYTVSFSVSNPDAIQALTISSGNVTFASTSSTARTLRVNSASGTQDASISGASTSLTLGASPSNDVNLVVGDDISIQNDASLTAQFDSNVTASDFSALGLNGSIVMDGPGTTLTLTGVGANNFIGRSGNDGYLLLLEGTTGNSIAGNLRIADSGTANSLGGVNISGGSTLSLAGFLTLANQGVAGQSATLDIYDANSSLIQTGASSIVVGADANSSAAINIGVASEGGTLTTGTGTMTINATGEVNIGAIGFPSTSGTLNANGNVVIDGGVLRRILGDFVVAPNRTLTVQNGGLLDIRSSYEADATFVVTGSGSTWTTSIDLAIGAAGTGALTVSSAGTVSTNLNDAHIGRDAGSGGDVTVTGAGSTWTIGDEFRVGDQGTGTLTIAAGGEVSSSGAVAVGFSPIGDGVVTVTGAGSEWTSASALRVGKEGTGALTISAGGAVSNTAGRIAVDPGSEGDVTVSDAGSTWTNSLELSIGFAGVGMLRIEDGGEVSNTGAILGDFGSHNPDTFIGGEGHVTVTGAGSTWTNSEDLVVGREGIGTLAIENGGAVTNVVGFVGVDAGTDGHGAATVTGSGSTWSMSALRVAGSLSAPGGAGAATVSSGGLIEVTGNATVWNNGAIVLSTGGTLTAGSATIQGGDLNVSGGMMQTLSGSVVLRNGAQANVTGGGSLSSASFLDIGISGGGGTLVVSGTGASASGASPGLHSWALNGQTANVTFSNGANGSFPGGILLAGSATAGTTADVDILTGADMTVGSLFLAAVGGATTSATLTVNGAGSTITQTGSSTLFIGHPLTGSASLVVENNATFTTGTGTIVVDNTGSLEINSGALFDAYGTIQLSGGSFDFLGGTLHVDNFDGDLVNQGGTLAPGHSAGATSISGQYEQAGSATLQIELGGTTAGTQFDTLSIGGETTLAGILGVVLINSFTPTLGDTFQIIRSAGDIHGTFGIEQLPALAGGLFLDVQYTLNEVVLSTAGVLGDYNRNGSVDAADYIVWRMTFGDIGSGLPADGDANGQVDLDDLDVWRTHFGETAGSGSTEASPSQPSVPEPGSLVLILIGLAGLSFVPNHGRSAKVCVSPQ